jgi:hypothetical protein
VFAIILVVTLGYTSLPPGKMIYQAVLPNTEVAQSYLVFGSIPAIDLIVSVFNGVIYGFIVWLLYTLLLGRKKQTQNDHQTVNVNIQDKGEKKEVHPT